MRKERSRDGKKLAKRRDDKQQEELYSEINYRIRRIVKKKRKKMKIGGQGLKTGDEESIGIIG